MINCGLGYEQAVSFIGYNYEGRSSNEKKIALQFQHHNNDNWVGENIGSAYLNFKPLLNFFNSESVLIYAVFPLFIHANDHSFLLFMRLKHVA